MYRSCESYTGIEYGTTLVLSAFSCWQDYSYGTYRCVVVVILTLTRITKSVVTGQAPVTLELRIPQEKTHTTQGGTRIPHLTQFMPPPETYKSEIGSQSTMCQTQAGAYVSLLTPGETKYSDCHPDVIRICGAHTTRTFFELRKVCMGPDQLDPCGNSVPRLE